MGTVTPQPQNVRGKPGQAGFVQRGASCSSPQLTLPSFSTEEDEDEDDENDDDYDENAEDEDEEEEDTEDEEEVDFPKQGAGQRR